MFRFYAKCIENADQLQKGLKKSRPRNWSWGLKVIIYVHCFIQDVPRTMMVARQFESSLWSLDLFETFGRQPSFTCMKYSWNDLQVWDFQNVVFFVLLILQKNFVLILTFLTKPNVEIWTKLIISPVVFGVQKKQTKEMHEYYF